MQSHAAITFLALLCGLSFLILVAAECTGVRPPEGVLSNASGTIFTDAEGSPSSNYRPNMMCSWRIACPQSGAQYVAIALFISAATYNRYDQLEIFDQNSVRVAVYPGLSGKDAVLVAGSSSTVSWATDAYGRTSRFVVEYYCREAMCSSVNTTTSVADNSSTIVSDVDGVGSSYRTAAGESCWWNISCDAFPNKVFIGARIDTALASRDVLTVSNATGSAVLSLTSSQFKATFLRMSSMGLRLNTNQSGGSGFTLKYACLDQACSSERSPGGTTYTSMEGLIQSDSDGSGPEHYLPGENCTWRIQCPQNYTIRLSQLVGTTWSSSDYMSVQMVGSALRTDYANSFDFPQYLPNAEATVSFVTSLSSATSSGFTIQYSCSVSACSSLNATGSMYRQATGILLTDMDGSASASKYIANERCLWSVQCPNPSDKIALFVTGYTQRSTDVLDVSFPNGTGITSFSLSQDGGGVMIDSDAIGLRFSTTGAGSSGYSVRWGCQSSMCQSPQSSSPLTSPSGTILSDPDGSGTATRYVKGELCDWTIACPAGYSVLALKISGSLSSQDVLNVSIPGSGSTVSLRGSISIQRFFPSAMLSLSFHPKTSYSGGFVATYMCLTSQCISSVPSGSTLSSTSGVISTDFDGRGTLASYFNDESCDWTANCADEFFVMNMLIGQTSNVYDNVTITSRSSKNTFYGKLRTQMILPATGVSIAFNTNNDGVVSSGFDLYYTCSADYCSSMNRSQSTFTNPSGSIISDWDGELSATPYLSSERCSYTIACPARWSVLVRKLVGTLYSSDSIYLYRVVNGNKATFNSYTDTISFNGFIDANEVAVVFSSAPGSSSRRYGYRLDYSCREAQCSSDSPPSGTVLQALQGEILSDVDGQYSAYAYVTSEKCAWTIQCPSGWYVSLRMVGTTEYSDVLSLQWVDTLLLSKKMWAFSYSAAFNSIELAVNNTVSVGFQSQDTNNGFTVQYTCQPPTASCAASSPPQLRETSGSIDWVSGSGATEACAWSVECPLYVHLWGQLVGSSRTITSKLRSTQTSVSVLVPGDISFVAVSPAVLWVLNNDTSAASQLHLRYECTPNFCTSVNRSGSKTVDPWGIIVSDVDGADAKFTYQPYESCTWYIECPASYAAISVDVQRVIKATETVKLTPAGSLRIFYLGYGV